MKKSISLISVYNNEALVNQMMESAKTQENVVIDYVLIDNTKCKYSSASKALNYGFSKSKGNVVVFLHQDIEFLDSAVLEEIYDYAIENPKTIFGAAGVEDRNICKDVKILSSMADSKWGRYDTLSVPTKVLTLDECLIACNRSCMVDIRFDEIVCDGWHLYGADLCLQAQAYAGLNVEAVPMNVWHKSSGNADKNYYVTQKKVARKYKKHYKMINTTNGWAYTNWFMNFILSLYRRLRYGGVVE